MSTKLTGDITEQAAILHALKRGWGVLRPILFYVFPVAVFISYASEIHLVEADKRQRKPRSSEYRDAWELILQWAARKETYARSPVKVGEAVSGVTPSQALVVTSPVKV